MSLLITTSSAVAESSEYKYQLGVPNSSRSPFPPCFKTKNMRTHLERALDTMPATLFSNSGHRLPGRHCQSCLTKSQYIIDEIVEHIECLVDGSRPVIPLYSFDDYVLYEMSYWEAGYWLAMSTLTFGAILFNYYAGLPAAQSAGYIMATFGKCAVLVTLAWFSMGKMDLLQAAAEIVGWVLDDMVEALIEVLSGDPFAYAIFVACVIVTIAAWGASAGTIATAQVAAALISGIAFAINILNDMFDADTIVG